MEEGLYEGQKLAGDLQLECARGDTDAGACVGDIKQVKRETLIGYRTG